MAAIAGATVGALVLTALPAQADGGGKRPAREPVEVVAEGLNGPFGIDSAWWDRFLYVSEVDRGQVTRVDSWTGATKPVVEGFTGLSGAARVDGRFVLITGEAGGGPEGDEGAAALATSSAARSATATPATAPQASAVYVSRRSGAPRLLADLLAYELANNPDGQVQFGPDGAPLDALSNPFDVLEDRRRGGYVLVADAGANAVLAVDRKGNVTTFFVPPLVTTGACGGAPNNDPDHVGCDPVPTALAYGPGGDLYVSTLSSFAPGEGRVYVLDGRTAAVKRVVDGFTAPTGVAAGKRGTVYAAELLEGAPETEEPPPGFDPSTVGQIVRVAPDGSRSTAQVTLPSSLHYEDGVLYATAWALAGSFLGIPDAGQLVRVRDSAFVPAA